MHKGLIILFLLLGCANAAIKPFRSNITPLSTTMKKAMRGTTWHKGCPVPLKDLAYVNLTYYGFDHKAHPGALIVNKHLAHEVVKIFKVLYNKKFPIKSMQPMLYFKGNDLNAMAANNTSAFNCRPITGSKKYSMHAYGRAIDINPLINPYVRNHIVLPMAGKPYVNRKLEHQGMIKKNSFITQVFKHYQWTWGGDWKSLKDFQHFQKRN